MAIDPKPMDKNEIESIVSRAVTEAVDFVESNIASDRIKAQRYFDGEVDIGEEEGRSKIVATKVRDTIRAIKPSLMRVFLSSDRAVEFLPRKPEDAMMANQATQYIQYKLQKLNGFRLLNDAFHDALVKKVGVIKVYWSDAKKSKTFEFSNLTDEELSVIVNEDDVTVLEQTTETSAEVDEYGMEVERPKHSIRISKEFDDGHLMAESVPPEEFIVDANAKSIDNCYVCAHRTEMRVSDLVEMGFDYDEVADLSNLGHSDTFAEAEDFERRNYWTDEEEEINDPAMKLVAITEAYMKIDVDGTGVAQMHKFMLGGGDYKLLDYEPCDDIPFAVFEVDPEPHAFFGRSIADLIMNDQDASTAMLRGVLDNVALTNNPRIGFVEGQVNVDDLLNNEIGGIVRMKSAGAMQDIAIPFVAGQTLTAMQYLDDMIEGKTGVSKASMGLDPDALQNTTATAAQITAQAGAAQVENMARNLAEGGMTRLFKLMLKEIIENSCEEEMMRFNGSFTPIDPRSWNAEMDLITNVGLGTGREDEKMSALQQALQMQMQIWSTYGPTNGMVSMTLIRNTLSDVLALAGVRNAERYFLPMDEQTEQQLIMQQQQLQAQQGMQDPNAALAQAQIQAEQIRAQSKAQTDMLKAQIDAQKAIAEDDRERDKMDQDLLIKAAEMVGKYDTAVDVEEIKRRQDAPRYPDQTPTEAIQGGNF